MAVTAESRKGTRVPWSLDDPKIAEIRETENKIAEFTRKAVNGILDLPEMTIGTEEAALTISIFDQLSSNSCYDRKYVVLKEICPVLGIPSEGISRESFDKIDSKLQRLYSIGVIHYVRNKETREAVIGFTSIGEKVGEEFSKRKAASQGLLRKDENLDSKKPIYTFMA